MANHCSNVITITDHYDPVKYESFKALMQQLEDTEEEYQPEDKSLLWMSEIQTDGDTFSCISRWDPCHKTMVELAKHYELSFILEYEEGGMCLFGEYEYDGDTEKLTYRFIPEAEWIVDDGTSDSWYDDMDRLLQNKTFKDVEI